MNDFAPPLPSSPFPATLRVLARGYELAFSSM